MSASEYDTYDPLRYYRRWGSLPVGPVEAGHHTSRLADPTTSMPGTERPAPEVDPRVGHPDPATR